MVTFLQVKVHRLDYTVPSVLALPLSLEMQMVEVQTFYYLNNIYIFFSGRLTPYEFHLDSAASQIQRDKPTAGRWYTGININLAGRLRYQWCGGDAHRWVTHLCEMVYTIMLSIKCLLKLVEMSKSFIGLSCTHERYRSKFWTLVGVGTGLFFPIYQIIIH